MTDTAQSAPITIDTTRMLAFDLETTGPDPRSAHIVTAALVGITGNEVSSTTRLADPGIEIPEGATAVHGITTEHARTHGRPHADVLSETIDGIRAGWADGRVLVVFNAAYDLTILRRFDPTFEVTGPVLDPYVVDRALDPYRKGKRTLTAMCEHYGIELTGAHDASADALGAARLAWVLAQRSPDLLEIDWRELMRRQQQWHAERQLSFREYLERSGKDASGVNTDWPLAR